ncbi:MAG: alpha/beta fold hydrolase [Fimbriiglobus sp.]
MKPLDLFAECQGTAGPVIVLLHAFPLDGSMWSQQVAALLPGHRVIVIDAPGFGRSPVVDNWSIESFADAIAGKLDSLQIQEPVILGGLSMGGYVALAFARRHPERLRALILADTRCEPDSPEARAGRAKSMDIVRTGGTAALVEVMLPNALGVTTQASRPDVVARFREIGTSQKTEATLAALAALRDRPDAEPGLLNIKVPTLVIVGDEDKITPWSAADKLYDKIPPAKLIVIPEAGHLANLEQPSLFNDVIHNFLTSLHKRAYS